MTNSRPDIELPKHLIAVIIGLPILVSVLVAFMVTHLSQREAIRSSKSDIVATQHRSCLTGAGIYARVLNEIRNNYTANKIVSEDPKQPKVTRDARRAQLKNEQDLINYFTSILDSGTATQKVKKTDREEFLISSLVDRKSVASNGVSCDKLYPEP